MARRLPGVPQDEFFKGHQPQTGVYQPIGPRRVGPAADPAAAGPRWNALSEVRQQRHPAPVRPAGAGQNGWKTARRSPLTPLRTTVQNHLPALFILSGGRQRVLAGLIIPFGNGALFEIEGRRRSTSWLWHQLDDDPLEPRRKGGGHPRREATDTTGAIVNLHPPPRPGLKRHPCRTRPPAPRIPLRPGVRGRIPAVGVDIACWPS